MILGVTPSLLTYNLSYKLELRLSLSIFLPYFFVRHKNSSNYNNVFKKRSCSQSNTTSSLMRIPKLYFSYLGLHWKFYKISSQIFINHFTIVFKPFIIQEFKNLKNNCFPIDVVWSIFDKFQRESQGCIGLH